MTSKLFDETTFYNQFFEDLSKAKKEVIIESPYITSRRIKAFFPFFAHLLSRKVNIYVMTRTLDDQDINFRGQIDEELYKLESLGVQTLLCLNNHHRKLVILDRQILWEGSLNILSQTDSREIMRRIDSNVYAQEMFRFLKMEKFICS